MGQDLERRSEAPQQGSEVALSAPTPPNPKTDDWALVIRPIANLAEEVKNTDFVPQALRGKPAAITAAVLFGRELDMPPMQALQQVHVIDGRPSLSAEHLRAMVLAAGHYLVVQGDGGSATATGRRLLRDGTYGEPVSVTWTLNMASAAKLTGKSNWQKHPRQMLKARATAELCRDLFPDVTHGLVAVEEAGDDASEAPDMPPSQGPVSRKPRKAVASKTAAGPSSSPESAAPPTAAAATPAPPLPGEDLGDAGAGSGPVTGEPAPAPDLPEPGTVTRMREPSGGTIYTEGPYAGQPMMPGGPDPEVMPVSEGDGSPDDLAATADDPTFMEARFGKAQEAAGEAVPDDRSGRISPGQMRALGAAFGHLHVSNDDRHKVTSALLGREVSSWNQLTQGDADHLFRVLQDATAEELQRLANG